MVSLKQLAYFHAVATHGHFGRAAEACAISQPALSMQVQALERSLGVPLVERRRQGIALTDEGVETARRAGEILEAVKGLSDFAEARRTPLSGRLRLGVIPSVAPYLLPPVLPILRARRPGLALHIAESKTDRLLERLGQGALDLLILALPVEEPEVATLPLFEDRFLLAAAEDADLPMAAQATPEMVARDRLLLLEEGHCLRDQALSFCGVERLRPVGGIDTYGASSLSTLVQMVVNGMGITLLPEISVPLETRGGGVRLRRFAPPEPSRTVGLAWRRSSGRAGDADALAALIAESRGATP